MAAVSLLIHHFSPIFGSEQITNECMNSIIMLMLTLTHASTQIQAKTTALLFVSTRTAAVAATTTTRDFHATYGSFMVPVSLSLHVLSNKYDGCCAGA